jgi:hypothetical protein
LRYSTLHLSRIRYSIPTRQAVLQSRVVERVCGGSGCEESVCDKVEERESIECVIVCDKVEEGGSVECVIVWRLLIEC